MKLAEVYDQNAGYWDSTLYRTVYHGAYVRLFRTLQRAGALGRPKQVLDCGIGAGLLSEALLDIADWRPDLNGIDRSSKLLTMAESKFNRRGVRARLALGDIRSLPYRDEEMELVLSGLVLEHIPKPVDAVREMTRVLRRGSLLVLTATRRGAPDHYFRRKYRYTPYPAAALLSWMKEAGLTEVRAYPFSGIARFFARAYVGVRV